MRSLSAWSSRGWFLIPAVEPAPQLFKALNYNENEPAKGPHPWASPAHAVPHAGEMIGNVFQEKLTKPEEIEALSVQMFVARLTKKQDKYFVRIRPHLAARVAWHEAITALDGLARSQVPPLEILVDLASDGLRRAQASQEQGQGTEGRRRLME